HGRARRDAAGQRLPVGVLHARRLPRAARRGRPGVARGDGLPGRDARLRGRGGSPAAVLLAVLARARPRVGRPVHVRLPDGSPRMINSTFDHAPGDIPEEEGSRSSGLLVYTIGLLLAGVLTAISFWIANTGLLWGPGTPLGLAVLAIAQMGVHLVFFLHIT